MDTRDITKLLKRIETASAQLAGNETDPYKRALIRSIVQDAQFAESLVSRGERPAGARSLADGSAAPHKGAARSAVAPVDPGHWLG